MLFKIKEALVIDALHKKTREPHHTIHDASSVVRENHDHSHSTAGFVTALLRAMHSRVLLCSTRSWFSMWGSRLFSSWPLCLTLGLTLAQLALESALANSVVFIYIPVRDAVAAAPSDGQHVYEIASEEIPMMPFGR